MVGAPRGNRALHLARTRTSLRTAALDLFEEVGFADATVAMIAERAGVSLRTFFRYFDSKEATLFGEDLQEWTLEFIAARPSGESLRESLRHAGLALADQAGAGGERRRRLRAELQREDPSIRSYGRRLLLSVEPRVEALAARRLGVADGADPRPAVFAGLWTAMVTYLFEHAGPDADARQRAEHWLDAALQLLDE